MADLRKRMFSQGISLEQFAFQFVVVLLGVYLAIFFENKAEDRSRAADARAMLVNVLGEMELDEEEILDRRQAQVETVRAAETLMDLLATASPAEDAAIDSIMSGPSWPSNPTVFPRRSAYSALVAGGNMGYLSDTDLTLRLANLYEHHYVRLVNHGDWTDRITYDHFWPVVNGQYWDKAHGRLVQRGEEANLGFWNLVHQRGRVAGKYIIRLDELLVELRAIKASLQVYLDE